MVRRVSIELSLSITILLLAFFLNVSPRLLSAYNASNGHIDYLFSDPQAYAGVSLYMVAVLGALYFYLRTNRQGDIAKIFEAAMWGCVLSVIGAFYADLFYLMGRVKFLAHYELFGAMLDAYFRQEYWFYAVIICFAILLMILKQELCNEIASITSYKKVMTRLFIAMAAIQLLFIFPLKIMNIVLLKSMKADFYVALPLSFSFFLSVAYFSFSVALLGYSYWIRLKNKLPLESVVKLTNAVGVITMTIILIDVMLTVWPYKMLALQLNLSPKNILFASGENLRAHAVSFIPLFGLLMVAMIFRHILKRQQFSNALESSETSGDFGTAVWASKEDLEKLNAYDEKNGLFIGNDEHDKPLFLPLYNKLTLSPPGGGKTSSSSIPALLSYDGPAFVFDVKGELWAVTARYRAEVLKRNVVAIDPFGVTKGRDFQQGKQGDLLKEYTLNPFDWIPEERGKRDRMINAFAASFMINEGGYAVHFDENAKILIRGYIDYMMTLDKESRNLAALYYLMSEKIEDALNTFDQMSQLSGRAGAAANQISRVGSDERGSILSTSYRQIDWMSDSNIQRALLNSNFDLRDFLKGNMDIYIVIPEDQVKDQSRLVRMMMSLLMGMIVQAEPSELPKKKMFFLLEELAQLGYCPDVEQFIEVLRGRGVVVWSIFQTLSQIEMFKKPDLFKIAPIKQIFTSDDPNTMQWIQTLGGKKTIVTKTLSMNQGDTRQHMQILGGSVSSGEGESVHETGTDLIQLNEIRELPGDKQFVFVQGCKVIRCKKVRYFEHPFFAGKFDVNPMETKE